MTLVFVQDASSNSRQVCLQDNELPPVIYHELEYPIPTQLVQSDLNSYPCALSLAKHTRP